MTWGGALSTNFFVSRRDGTVILYMVQIKPYAEDVKMVGRCLGQNQFHWVAGAAVAHNHGQGLRSDLDCTRVSADTWRAVRSGRRWNVAGLNSNGCAMCAGRAPGGLPVNPRPQRPQRHGPRARGCPRRPLPRGQASHIVGPVRVPTYRHRYVNQLLNLAYESRRRCAPADRGGLVTEVTGGCYACLWSYREKVIPATADDRPGATQAFRNAWQNYQRQQDDNWW